MDKEKNKEKTKAKKEKISFMYFTEIGKHGAKKFKAKGELGVLCESDKLREEMLDAVGNGGRVFAYSRKKEIKAVCIFKLEERGIPLDRAAVSEKELFSGSKSAAGKKKACGDKTEDNTNDKHTEQAEDELVRKNCYVMTALYIVPSYEELRGDLEKLFRRMIVLYMDEIPAYVWGDELIMLCQLKSGGRYENLWPITGCIGMVIGMLLGAAGGNVGVYMMFGLSIGIFVGLFIASVRVKTMSVPVQDSQAENQTKEQEDV